MRQMGFKRLNDGGSGGASTPFMEDGWLTPTSRRIFWSKGGLFYSSRLRCEREAVMLQDGVHSMVPWRTR